MTAEKAADALDQREHNRKVTPPSVSSSFSIRKGTKQDGDAVERVPTDALVRSHLVGTRSTASQTCCLSLEGDYEDEHEHEEETSGRRHRLVTACAIGLLLSLFPNMCRATAPELASILPTGGQRGTELEISFHGKRLQDAEEIIFYEPGFAVEKLQEVTNEVVKARVKILPDCSLGEHHVRVRARSGVSELRTFVVGSFPTIDETEPNNEPAKAQKITLPNTIAGIIKNEDVDCFAVELKKGELFSAEVEGMRLGRGNFDPRLTLLDSAGAVVADVDDTWLGMQDPFISLIAAKDDKYLLRLREATYGGNDNCHYRLHVGAFPRPTTIFPLGAQAGATVAFAFFSEATGWFTNTVTLPRTPEPQFPVFAERNGSTAPTPNWVRVSAFSNAPPSAPGEKRESAAAVDLSPPLALNGILAQKGQEHWFRFPASKGEALEVSVYARRLRSPLDSIIEVFDAQGRSLGANDDAEGADSNLRFTPPESTNYFVCIRDTLGQGGPEFAYRIEVAPPQPALAVKIPEVARNDTQGRQFMSVPRGNRFATLISAKRSNFSSPVALDIQGLLSGVKMVSPPLPANVESVPVIFEAGTDAPFAGKLLDLVATGTNGSTPVIGKFQQHVDLVEAPNNASFYGTTVDKLCVAVTKEAPFHLRLVPPKVPLVQAGSMPLEIEAERDAGFDEPIELQLLWRPPGIHAQPEITIPKGGTNASYTLNADGGAELRTWPVAVLGHATVEGGQVYLATAFADLEVAAPFLTGKIETVWLNPGRTAKLTVNLQHKTPFDGKAKIRLLGLPDKVSAAEREITKDDPKVVFEVAAQPECRPGSYRNLFCAVDVPQAGEVIAHTIAQGGILRVVPPKKGEANLAAADKK